MHTYPIYCAGQFIQTNDELKVLNPFSGEIVARTFRAGKDQLEAAILKAQEVKEQMKNLPSWKRCEILKTIADALLMDKERLASILAMESAKPLMHARTEIERAAQTFFIAAEESKRLPKEYLSLDWTTAGTGKEGIVKYFPAGLVAGIAPFNFPMNLAVHKIAPAIAAGCPIILKPASSTPLSTLELAKIIDATDLPKGAVAVLPMDRKAGNQLVTDERFALLSFTGSPEVGWEMKSNAGRKKVVLELGGNAGTIITPTADLQHAVNRAVAGGFSYSGQVCIHAQRFIVHRSVFAAFTEAFVDRVKKLKQGNPLEHDTELSSMIDEENATRVENWVNEAVAAGARLLCGGKRNGTFYEATVLTNTKAEMKVCCEEVFGPVVTVEVYDDFDEAIRYINNTRFGLQAGIFTHDQREIDQAFDQIEAGGVIVNDVPTFRVDHMPYGGVKDSGSGREGVRYAILDMMEPKILVK
ncbi:MAG: aldehyde dehydrogenase family protein [Bacteroidia bacterium]